MAEDPSLLLRSPLHWEGEVPRTIKILDSTYGDYVQESVRQNALEMVPRCCPGAGASRLGRDGPAPPLSRAAGALTQVCRQTGRAKNRRGSGTGGTPGRIRTDHIVRHRGGEPPRAHRRAGRRGTRPRRQRGESSSRRHGRRARLRGKMRASRVSSARVCSIWGSKDKQICRSQAWKPPPR